MLDSEERGLRGGVEYPRNVSYTEDQEKSSRLSSISSRVMVTSYVNGVIQGSRSDQLTSRRGLCSGNARVLAYMPRIDWYLGILKDALRNCCQCCSWRRRSRTNALV
jgi:hypothetical protein